MLGQVQGTNVLQDRGLGQGILVANYSWRIRSYNFIRPADDERVFNLVVNKEKWINRENMSAMLKIQNVEVKWQVISCISRTPGTVSPPLFKSWMNELPATSSRHALQMGSRIFVTGFHRPRSNYEKFSGENWFLSGRFRWIGFLGGHKKKQRAKWITLDERDQSQKGRSVNNRTESTKLGYE